MMIPKRSLYAFLKAFLMAMRAGGAALEIRSRKLEQWDAYQMRREKSIGSLLKSLYAFPVPMQQSISRGIAALAAGWSAHFIADTVAALGVFSRIPSESRGWQLVV